MPFTNQLLIDFFKQRMVELYDREKVKNYLKSHIRNLEWHLSRIYHMRNELVHEAASKRPKLGYGQIWLR